MSTETKSRTLSTRAAELRSAAATMLEPLAIAYRRRAAELELVAAVLAGARPAIVTP